MKMEVCSTEEGTPVSETVQEGAVVELPVELHRCIIEFMDSSSDVGTIAQCALVCRAWFAFTRDKLWCRVDLRSRQQWARFRDSVLYSTSETMVQNLKAVRKLSVALPVLYDLMADQDEEALQIGWAKGKERPWTHLAVQCCSTQLTGLDCVFLWHIDWSQGYNKTALRSGCYYRSVTVLDISYCRFSTVRQMCIFIAAFPALVSLTIHRVTFTSEEAVPSCLPKGGHPLTYLWWEHHEDIGRTIVPQYLMNAQLTRNLSYLCWGTQNREMWEKLKDLWEAFSDSLNGPSLLELELWERGPEPCSVDFSRFTRLKILRLYHRKGPLAKHIASLKHTFSNISSLQLEMVSITCDISRVDFFKPEYLTFSDLVRQLDGLEDVDDILARPQYRNLRFVGLNFSLRSAVSDLFEKKMPSSVNSWFSGRSVNSWQPGREIQRRKIPAIEKYMENTLRDRFFEKLPKINSRGVLHIR